MNKAKKIDTKNCTYCCFNDIINIKNLIKKNKDRLKAIQKCYCLPHWVHKGLSYTTINRVNHL